MIRKFLTPALLASAILTQPAAAQEMPEMSEQEMSAFVRVAMPGAFRSLQQKCRPAIPADAYIYSSGEDVHARMLLASRYAWPDAAHVIARAASRNDPAMGEVLSGMPPEVLRPFVDEMIAGMVSSRIETKDCLQINRALELLDPLPPENLAELIGMIYAESQKSDERAATAAETRSQ